MRQSGLMRMRQLRLEPEFSNKHFAAAGTGVDVVHPLPHHLQRSPARAQAGGRRRHEKIRAFIFIVVIASARKPCPVMRPLYPSLSRAFRIVSLLICWRGFAALANNPTRVPFSCPWS